MVIVRLLPRHEFRHMYPRAPLREAGTENNAINCLANMCILSRADNNKIRCRRPSEYRELMPEDELAAILKSAATSDTLFSDDFEAFRDERSQSPAVSTEPDFIRVKSRLGACADHLMER